MADSLQSFIAEKLHDTIHNADVMSMLQKLAESVEGEQADTLKGQLGDIVKQYNDMSEEEKKMFLVYIKEMLARKLAMHFQNNPPDLSQVEDVLAEAVKGQIMIFAVVVGVIVFIVGMEFELFGITGVAENNNFVATDTVPELRHLTPRSRIL